VVAFLWPAMWPMAVRSLPTARGHFNVVDLLSWTAMDDTALLTCPYCFEKVEVYIDPQSEGELIRDCDVCCRPWSLQVSRGVGSPSISVLPCLSRNFRKSVGEARL